MIVLPPDERSLRDIAFTMVAHRDPMYLLMLARTPTEPQGPGRPVREVFARARAAAGMPPREAS